MFVKKLVEKASINNKLQKSSTSASSSDGLQKQKQWKGSGDEIDMVQVQVQVQVVFHYGIPFASSVFAYEYHPIQSILAISTNDGRIKLFGTHNNTQALLQPEQPHPTKFLQFFHNQGFLVNVTSNNNIQVWDLETNMLCDVYAFQQEITSFTVLQQSAFMFVGDTAGDVSIMKLEKEPCRIVPTNYTVPFANSHGNPTEVCYDENVVTHILPQPMAESKRVLIIFRDGLVVLWDIRESKTIFTTGGSLLQSLHHETLKVTAACWACPFGTRVVVGYDNGEIFVWGIPPVPNLRSGSTLDSTTQNNPICKLNVGYKLNKIPIASLKWSYTDGKASRLYVMGASNLESETVSQVVLLNEHTESRMIKLGLHLPEPCNDMEIISVSGEKGKHRQDYLLLIGKSGHIYAYDDCAIEKYLLQCQSRSHQSLPKEVMVKMPFFDSDITVSKFITDNPCLDLADKDYVLLAKELPHMFSFENKAKDGSSQFSGFSRVKNLYITGHANGAITFWDVSSPAFIPIITLKQQSEDDLSLSGIAVTALFFDVNSRLLVSGDQSGTVRIYKLKPDRYTTENSFLSLQGNTKKGNSHIINSFKLLKINGAVICLSVSHSSRHLAIGSDQGYVSVVDIEGPTTLYQQHIESELCSEIISLQFVSCSLHGFEKNVLAVATKDSSVLALDSDTGSKLSTNAIQPKKPFKALFMHILHGSDCESSKGKPAEDGGMSKQPLLLLCSEKALYLYSFTHVIQGVKKVICKKKFQSICCWASIFYCSSEVGLILLYTNGRIEIRSLPELKLLKETSIRGFAYSTPKSNSLSETSISSSLEGNIVMVNGDQEIFVVSVLPHKKLFRHLDSASQIYRKDLVAQKEGLVSVGPVIHKEKNKGIFSSIISGNKPKPVPDPLETEDARQSFKDLEAIFLTANFPAQAEGTADNKARDDEEIELDIDDIDIDAVAEKPKEQIMLAALNKQSLASKFQGLIKGKMKQMKSKNEKNRAIKEEEEQGEKAKGGSVDQIKRKYGFSKAKEGETSIAKMAESKLQEGVSKLQGINVRATHMQDTAKSFSSLAKQVLQTQQDTRGRGGSGAGAGP